MLAQKHFPIFAVSRQKRTHRIMTGNRCADELNFDSVPRLAPSTYLRCRKVSEIISPLNPCDLRSILWVEPLERKKGKTALISWNWNRSIAAETSVNKKQRKKNERQDKTQSRSSMNWFMGFRFRCACFRCYTCNLYIFSQQSFHIT